MDRGGPQLQARRLGTPAGLIFSILGAILVLFICYKLNIHFPSVNPF
jgi:hypothetical protein